MDNKTNKWLRLMIVSLVSGIIITIMTYWLIVNDLKLKMSNYQPAFIRELTDVENWKLFLYQEVLKTELTYSDYLLLRKIAFCESTWRQWDKNGNLLVSYGNQGLFQINKLAHEETYTAMGLDVSNPYDNIKYAVYLYKKNGIRDWEKWSGHCFLKK